MIGEVGLELVLEILIWGKVSAMRSEFPSKSDKLLIHSLREQAESRFQAVLCICGYVYLRRW